MNSYYLKKFALLLLGSMLSVSLIAFAHAKFPLPQDVRIVVPGANIPAQAAAFSGVWAGGAWDGLLPHLLIVENIATTGGASVIYSTADAPDMNSKASSSRVQGKIENGRLTFTLKDGKARVEYVIGTGGDLNGTFTIGDAVSRIVLAKTTLEKLVSLASIDAVKLSEETLRIPVRYGGDSSGAKELSLEATLYRPNKSGRFPVVVFNHGSTGPGLIPANLTQKPTILARYFVEKGFAVLAPMRRGRGKSEGFNEEERVGYDGCGDEARGINLAVEDLDGVFIFLREQPWADVGTILIGGQSRGGILSVVYAGRRPDAVKGVINCSGGWKSDRCSPDSNGQFFAEAAQKATTPMIWLYAENDSFYSAGRIKSYRAAFEKAGGKGPFHIFKEANSTSKCTTTS
jgi:dienelactone hydrolase